MKHWNDGQHRIAGGEGQNVGRAARQRIDHDRPVRIQRALGVSRRAGGVAKRCGGSFVKVGPDKIVAEWRNEALVND